MVASRALNNQPYVSAEAAKRVKEAVVALGFQQNAFARGLSSDRSFIVVMVIVPETPDASGEFQRHALLRCRELGYHLIVERAPGGAAPTPLIEGVLDRVRPEAVILWNRTADDPEVLAMLERRQVPYARIDADPANPAGLIAVDHQGLMVEVAKTAGHDALVFAQSDSQGWLGRLRGQALGAAMASVGLSFTLEAVGDGGFDTGRAYGEAVRRTDYGQTVFLCESATFAHGFLSAWEGEEEAPPPLICLEDTSSLRLLAPGVTRGVAPLAAMARAALDMLLTRSPAPPPMTVNLRKGV